MKLKRIIGIFLAAVMVIMLAACSGQGSATGQTVQSSETSQTAASSETTQSSAVTITDMSGREITLEEPAERIVALTAADCEILYAIGGGDRLVGRGEYCDWPVEVLDVPSVQSGYETNIEQIISLKPQVVLMGTMAQTEEQIQALEEAGVHVVVSDAQDIEGVYTAILMIGDLMGLENNAAELVSSMQRTFSELRDASQGNSGTVYFEVSPLEWGLWAAGKNTFMDEIASILGLENIFADVDGWGEVSEEQVIERNPDYIVTITMYYGEGPTPIEEIEGRSGWENITAVKNGKILNLQNNELSRPGPRLAEGAQALADFIK